MDTILRIAALAAAAAAVGGCAVAPPSPAYYPQPATGVLYVEQGEDGTPSYIARDIATMSAEAPIVSGTQYGVVPGWSTYGAYGYAPYAYPPVGSSMFFGWSSGPVWRPYPYVYPGRPIAPRPPPAVFPGAPRALGAPPGAWPRVGVAPYGYRGPYRAPYRGGYRGVPAK
jgi:hypothetical protein